MAMRPVEIERTVCGWGLQRTDRRCLTLHIEMCRNPSSAWERWFLLRSDAHHDNLHCDRELELLHLRQAVERDACILDIGDLHCAMAGKWDKRADPTAFREEYRVNYLDSLVREAADFYEPFAANWVMMSPGNHETAVLRRHETDLTGRTIQALADRTGHVIQQMPYEGFVIFRVRRVGPRASCSLKMHYHHGAGGGGPVTKGMIGATRAAEAVEGMDLFWQGHIHESWINERSTAGCNDFGIPYLRQTWHIRTPGYKDEYVGDGFHVERGRPAKPIGAYWLRLTYQRRWGLIPQLIKADR